jgi:hypothetical protein
LTVAEQPRKALEAFGKTWVRFIRQEAKKDSKKSNYVPNTKEFLDSFSYQVEPNGIVAIYSTYEWLELATEGTRGKYRMTWLTRQAGVDVVPLMQQDGTVAFRTAPLTFGKAWVHPKIAKNTFIARAYDRALEVHLDAVLQESIENASRRKR